MDVKRNNAERKATLLTPLLGGMRTILDFGCGDLFMAKALKVQAPRLQITGVDVVDFGMRPKGIVFRQFDGKRLPFKNRAFDAAVVYHVFHHADDPAVVCEEVSRVTKKRMLVVEPVARGWWDIPGMILFDWLFNVWKRERIPMAYKFHTKTWWERKFRTYGLRVTKTIDVELLPFFLPTGRSFLFVCDRVNIGV